MSILVFFFFSLSLKGYKALQLIKSLSVSLKGACLLCCNVNGIVMAVPVGWKGVTTGLIRLHGVVKFSLPPPWCLWRVRDLFWIGQGNVMLPLPWAELVFTWLVQKMTWDGKNHSSCITIYRCSNINKIYNLLVIFSYMAGNTMHYQSQTCLVYFR